MTSWSLESFKDRFGSVALDIFPIDDNLDDAVPDFFGDIIAGQPDQVEDDVDVPFVVGGVFLSQNGYFQNLKEEK